MHSNIALGVMHLPFHYNYTMTTPQQKRFGGSAELCINYFVVQHCFFTKGGWSALMFASLNEHVEVVAELLQHGARVDIQQKVLLFMKNILCVCCFLSCN